MSNQISKGLGDNQVFVPRGLGIVEVEEQDLCEEFVLNIEAGVYQDIKYFPVRSSKQHLLFMIYPSSHREISENQFQDFPKRFHLENVNIPFGSACFLMPWEGFGRGLADSCDG